MAALASTTGGGKSNTFSSNFWGGLQQEGDDLRFRQDRGGVLGAGDAGGFGHGSNADDDSDDAGGGFDEGYGGGFGEDDAGVEETKGGEVDPVRLC